MAFAYTVDQNPISIGPRRMAWGSFTNDGGSTGGDIVTGMHTVFSMSLTNSGAAVSADAPTINETFPLASGSVTIVTTANTTGYWMAIGY